MAQNSGLGKQILAQILKITPTEVHDNSSEQHNVYSKTKNVLQMQFP